MAHIAKHLTELIGRTPLLELTNYEKQHGLNAHIIAKLEYFNPLGSVKDRVGNAMIEQGIRDGIIDGDTVLIEPTSGNTGIGLALRRQPRTALHTGNRSRICSEDTPDGYHRRDTYGGEQCGL